MYGFTLALYSGPIVCRILPMNFVNPRKNWRIRLLVLLLMLGAQSFSMAHELSHDNYGVNGALCEVCSAGHGLDTGLTVAHATPQITCSHQQPFIEPIIDGVKTAVAHYTARAPPLKDVT